MNIFYVQGKEFIARNKNKLFILRNSIIDAIHIIKLQNLAIKSLEEDVDLYKHMIDAKNGATRVLEFLTEEEIKKAICEVHNDTFMDYKLNSNTMEFATKIQKAFRTKNGIS